MIINTGQKWRSHRKLIAPTFHLNVLKSFIDLFNANARCVVEKMRKENGKEFDCHDYMSELTVDILLETAMGVSKPSQDHSAFEYAMAVMKYVFVFPTLLRKRFLPRRKFADIPMCTSYNQYCISTGNRMHFCNVNVMYIRIIQAKLNCL